MKKILCSFLCITLLCGCAPQSHLQGDLSKKMKTLPRAVLPAKVKESPQPLREAAPPERKEEVIIIFDTPIKDYTENRINNINLACKAVKGHVLAPGEEFSFNNVVGQRTRKKGYKEAIIFAGGEKKKEIGGGICQLATTIYGAAKACGMEITERRGHGMAVTYAPKGEDATVAYGLIDFRFKNAAPKPIMLDAACENGKVSVRIIQINF